METSQQDTPDPGTKPAVRKTRSGRIVRPPPPSTKSPKTPGKKTKKKMVLMEVEVSDDDDGTPEPEHTQEADVVENTSQDKENGKSETEPNECEKVTDATEKIDTQDDEKEVSKENSKEPSDDNTITALEEAVQCNINELHQCQENDKVEAAKKKEENESSVPAKKAKKGDIAEQKLVVTIERLDSQSIPSNSCEKKSKISQSEKVESSGESSPTKKIKNVEKGASDDTPPSKKLKTSDSQVKEKEKIETDLEQSKSDSKVTEGKTPSTKKVKNIEKRASDDSPRSKKPKTAVDQVKEKEKEKMETDCEQIECDSKMAEEKSLVDEKKVEMGEKKVVVEVMNNESESTEMNDNQHEEGEKKNDGNEDDGQKKDDDNKDDIKKQDDIKKDTSDIVDVGKKDNEGETDVKAEKEDEAAAEIKVEDIKVENEESKQDLKEETTPLKEEMDVDEDKELKPEPEDDSEKDKDPSNKDNCDPDTENISEDELPGVQVAKVPETEEVSDEELPGPKRAELPADTEVVSEDELPTVKKESGKRKLNEGEYDPGSPTSEHEAPTKKPALETTVEKEKEEKPVKPKKLPELDKYWKAVNDDPTDFTGWTYLLQYVDQENDMEAAREAYDAFLSHYPYCYGYWRKYADYEKRKGNKKKCEEVFERGFKAIPLSVDLWIHYMTYVKTARAEDEEFIRSQFERAISACGLEFRSDRLWDSYIKWESEGKRPQKVTAIYDRLLATPTQGYNSHFDNFQEHIASNAPNKVVEVDEFLALRKEVRHSLKQHEPTPEADNADAPPGDEDPAKLISSDEETKAIRERIISIRRKIHKNTSTAVTARWNYEEGIKRPYFHVKPLERCQLKNWQEYLEYEIEHGDRLRTIVLFERCLIACALYEEFWLKFVHYLEDLKDTELQSKIRDVYERACTIHHLKKPNLHLQWAVFEESILNYNKAAEILVNLEKSVPNVLQIAYRRINLERRRGDHEKCFQLYEHYMNNSKSKVIAGNIAIKYSRFCLKIVKNIEKATEILKNAITKDPTNPRLYLQQIDLILQQEGVPEKEVTEIIDSFLEKEGMEPEQKVLFAQRKLEFLEDFGSDIQTVQKAYEDYQKYIKQNKEALKKKETKSEPVVASKKDSKPAPPSTTSNTYGNYGNYGNSGQGSYQYSGSQGQYGYPQYGQGDQYQYQGWQYQQGNYGGYNQWGSYGSGYGY